MERPGFWDLYFNLILFYLADTLPISYWIIWSAFHIFYLQRRNYSYWKLRFQNLGREEWKLSALYNIVDLSLFGEYNLLRGEKCVRWSMWDWNRRLRKFDSVLHTNSHWRVTSIEVEACTSRRIKVRARPEAKLSYPSPTRTRLLNIFPARTRPKLKFRFLGPNRGCTHGQNLAVAHWGACQLHPAQI